METEQTAQINGKALLQSEIEFLKFVVRDYKPRNRLEEKDKQQVLHLLEFGFKKN